MALMESISGVRGIVGSSLTPDVIVRYADAYAEFCGGKPVVVGRDGRITGKMLTDIFISSLIAKGCDVRDIGVCPTPTVQLETEHSDAGGGVIVTASHNPIEWNGLKFLNAAGIFLDASENTELRGFFKKKNAYAPWNGIGSYSNIPEAVERHITAVLKMNHLDTGAIRGRNFKVVLDCVNAAGGVIMPELLERMGCAVIPLNCDVSGVFAHTPEPLPHNLTQLAEAVRAEGADIGIAVDPDVDRLVLIDEKGNPFGEEYTITTAVNFILSHSAISDRKRPVVINLSTTRAVDDVATKFGFEVIRTPVGEINVAKRMKETNALIGGEGSGGVIHPEIHYGRDAIAGTVIVLQQLLEYGRPLSEFRRSLPDYYIHKDKIAVAGTDPDEVLRTLGTPDDASGKVNSDDGVRIDYPEHWVHFRKSNTEPIIRIIAEASSPDRAADVAALYRKKIEQLLRG